MFRGEALTTDDHTACRFDTAEAEWKSDLLFARCKSHRLRKGRPYVLPTMTALDFRSLMIIHVVRGTFRQQKFLEPLPGLGHLTTTRAGQTATGSVRCSR